MQPTNPALTNHLGLEIASLFAFAGGLAGLVVLLGYLV